MPYPIELSFFDYSNLYLPVQALKNACIDYVYSIDCINEMANIESLTNNLSEKVDFIEESDGIHVPGEIKPVGNKYEIKLSLTFCQFMWTVGLYISTVFDNCVHIPKMTNAGINIYDYKVNMQAVEFANDSFFRARRLLSKGWQKGYFFDIPNICDPQSFKYEIDAANRLMYGGVAFMFTHELAHNMLGHTLIQANPGDVVNDEIAADKTALDYLSETFDTESGYVNKAGIANLLCSILLLNRDSVSGGGTHPHTDIRIETMLKQMDLNEMDMIWGYVGNAIRLWLLCYGDYTIKEDINIEPFDCYKGFYEFYLRKLREARQRLFPRILLPTWYTV